MRKILRNWLIKILNVQPELKVMDYKPMKADEYVFAFLVDENSAFYMAIMQLCKTMKSDYLAQCNDLSLGDNNRMDAIARMGAIDDFMQTVIFQRENAIRERDRINSAKK
jgi:hypothetical protein